MYVRVSRSLILYCNALQLSRHDTEQIKNKINTQTQDTYSTVRYSTANHHHHPSPSPSPFPPLPLSTW